MLEIVRGPVLVDETQLCKSHPALSLTPIVEVKLLKKLD